MPPPPEKVTQLLARWREGDRGALDELMPLVYDELRYFGGLSVEETAEVLGVGHATVTRDWNMARAWLMQELSEK